MLHMLYKLKREESKGKTLNDEVIVLQVFMHLAKTVEAIGLVLCRITTKGLYSLLTSKRLARSDRINPSEAAITNDQILSVLFPSNQHRRVQLEGMPSLPQYDAEAESITASLMDHACLSHSNNTVAK
jgi:hypothetical protein